MDSSLEHVVHDHTHITHTDAFRSQDRTAQSSEQVALRCRITSVLELKLLCSEAWTGNGRFLDDTGSGARPQSSD